MTAYPHPSPAPFSPQQPAPRKRGKGPLILMVIGGLILLGSLVASIAAVVMGASTLAGNIGDLQEMPEAQAVTHEAAEGEVIQLYKRAGAPVPSCRADGPQGESSFAKGTSQSSTLTKDGVEWESFDSFTAVHAGSYEIVCTGGPAAFGSPVSLGGIFGTVGGVVFGFLGGSLGVALLLAGIIWALVRRSRSA